jgi:hypothetical protein
LLAHEGASMNINEMPFAAINAGVAGCCTGLALSFPGTTMCNYQYYCLEFYLQQIMLLFLQF